MAKYIDAEKLKAELRRQKRELELSIQSQGDYGQSCHIVAYENILSLIDSLQQEQPELPKIAEYYYHKGIHEGLSQGRADALKILEESMKRKADPVIVVKQQEQLKVDLSEEALIEGFRAIRQKCFDEGIEGWQREKLIARHFFELGLNARKEE